MSWTVERIELLKKLWADGLSSSQIAGELGVTRNAVIGKLHRIRHVTRVRPKPKRHVKRTFAKAPKPPAPPMPIDVTDDAIPRRQRRALIKLENKHCRWPCGEPNDPGFFFCGHPSADVAKGRPYCAAHWRRAVGRVLKITDEERERRRAYGQELAAKRTTGRPRVAA